MKNEELDTILEKSFRTEFDFHLPADFAHKVTLTVIRREQWKTDLAEYLTLAGFIVGLLSTITGIYYFLDKEIVMQAFSFVTGHISLVVCVVFILNFILFADKVLLGLLFSRWSSR